MHPLTNTPTIVRDATAALATMSTQLHELEIRQRPQKTWPQKIHAFLFVVVFNLGCIMVNGFQFTCLLPLRLLPFPHARRLYDEGIRYSKGAFGTLLGVCLVSAQRAPRADGDEQC